MQKLLLTAIIAALLTFQAQAQNINPVPVEVSTEKVTVDGKIFYSHTVLPGQTLYSICRAYETTNEELAASNPSLKKGLKAGSILLIPVPGQEEVIQAAEASQPKWYQKLFKNKKKKEQETPVTSVAEIPAETDTVSAMQEDLATAQASSAAPARETYDASRPARIALVLPIHSRSTNPSQHSLDFYSGALQALYEVENSQSFNVCLSVLDEMELDQESLGSLASNDLIISTFPLDEIRPIAEFAAENSIPLVSAMDSKVDSLLSDNPYLIQIPVSHDDQIRNLVGSLDPRMSDRIYLFCDSRYPGSPLETSIRTYLTENGIDNFTPLSYDILRGRELGLALEKQWSTNSTYKIIVASEDAAFAPDVIRNLKVTGRYIPIQVFCSNKIRNFDSVDSDSFHLLTAHFSAPYFVDYGNSDTRDFVFKYRALFNTEPTAYSFQGHDILAYFLSLMQEEGSLFAANLQDHPMDLLQCSFNFVRSDEKSGWHNCATRDLVYSKDYTISVK